MADKDMMERVDMKAQFPNMSSTDQHFIKKGNSHSSLLFLVPEKNLLQWIK